MDNERIMNSIKHSIQAAEVRISSQEESEMHDSSSSSPSSSSSSSSSSPHHRSSTPTFVHDNPIGFADSDSSISVEVDFGESDHDMTCTSESAELDEPIQFVSAAAA